jgi:hypothetical protein
MVISVSKLENSFKYLRSEVCSFWQMHISHFAAPICILYVVHMSTKIDGMLIYLWYGNEECINRQFGLYNREKSNASYIKIVHRCTSNYHLDPVFDTDKTLPPVGVMVSC